MFIKAKVFPNSKKEEVIEKSKDSFDIFIREKPVGGMATRAAMRAVSLFFGLPASRFKIIKGHKQRSKIFEIINWPAEK